MATSTLAPRVQGTSTTLVTALYDIGRGSMSGKSAHRSFDKYLNWFKHVLSINVPMVVFIPDYLREYVADHRPAHYTTTVIVRKFEDLAAYRYYSRIQATIDSMVAEPPHQSHFKECPEFLTAKYQTIIFSKFDLLKEVAATNYYKSQYFLWLDAGTFYSPPPFDVTLEWPDPHKMQILNDRFLIPNISMDPSDVTPLVDKRSFLRTNRNDICTFCLGGSKSVIDATHRQFWAQVEDALSMGVINNEQNLMQLVILQNPDDYYLYYPTRTVHFDKSRPLRDRMVPYELALGTEMHAPYAVNPDLKVLTLATMEVPESRISRWLRTADYFGYDYDVLCRGDKWGGWNKKIRHCYEAMKKVDKPYTLICDCTDIFFAGSSHEMVRNFTEAGHNIMVGGEMYVHYQKGHNDREEVANYLDGIKQSPQRYPNGGFIMGRTSELLKLFQINLDYQDDQAGYFDAMYEHKIPMTIDYRTVLVGNVPNYRDKMAESVGYYEYDPVLHRYRSKIHGTYPCAFHFPGGNWDPMQEFYVKGVPCVAAAANASGTSSASTVDGETAAWIIIVILVVLLIILVIAAQMGARYAW